MPEILSIGLATLKIFGVAESMVGRVPGTDQKSCFSWENQNVALTPVPSPFKS